jgi:hypothetical protein
VAPCGLACAHHCQITVLYGSVPSIGLRTSLVRDLKDGVVFPIPTEERMNDEHFRDSFSIEIKCHGPVLRERSCPSPSERRCFGIIDTCTILRRRPGNCTDHYIAIIYCTIQKTTMPLPSVSQSAHKDCVPKRNAVKPVLQMAGHLSGCDSMYKCHPKQSCCNNNELGIL